MKNTKLDDSFNINLIENKKIFDVSGVVTAYYYESKPDFEPRYERYNFSQIILVMDGEGSYTDCKGTYEISPGKMIYRPADKASIYRWHTDNAAPAIISFVCRSEAMSVFEGGPIALHEEEIAILLDVIKTGARICEPLKESEGLRGMRFRDGVPDVVLGFISSSLERFLSMIYCRLMGIGLLTDESQKVGVYRDSSKLVSDIKAYMEENISKQITLGDMCTRFGVSQTALTKKFRQETGSGIMEYFIARKIAAAKRRIRESSESFTEISEALGFSASGYFSKVFKKQTGMTPTQYSKYASKRRSVK